MASYVSSIEDLDAEALQEKMAYMARCAKIMERKNAVYDDAKDHGVVTKVLKAVVKARSYERKAAAVEEALEDDDGQLFIDIREALGDYADLPLGQAAVASDDERTKAVVNAVKGSLTDKEQEAWDKAAPHGNA
jgi:uncharacterized protein (UPF0335 family)